jgi:hypothetical protein
MFTRIFLCSALLAACSISNANAQTVFQPGAGLFWDPSSATGNFGAALHPDLPLSASATIFFRLDGLKLTITSATLGIGIDVFNVAPDTIIDAAFATAHQYKTVLNADPTDPFLIGFALDDTPIGQFDSRDRYGWGLLQFSINGPQLQLSLLDSAMADQGFGIIAGTTTVIPEPSTICLAFSATVGLISFRRRHFSC